ncbi:hypothetical protein [Thermofilum pendens]|uniref:Uncharacterized protein n=1 Tax=Thermofilum pendens (strain DSM 2475 / Hrk 5) TaxID=368408 RepID=A1S0B7_THEPD|nr:hypothetical protein [Thermofilum pendens]ABL78897.1 hypothetical protein Tpen_1500 [Thermofilum pendens Hrk 5]
MRFAAETARRTILMANGEKVLDGNTREVLTALDVLRKAAIKPPQIVQLCYELRKAGIELNALTIQEAVEEIVRAYRSRVNRG